MFDIMKSLLKDKNEHNKINFANISVGYSVGFGFLPQRNISGCRLNIEEVNSYLFENDSFIAYRLKNDIADINLIITNDEKDLALSQRIKPQLFSPLFSIQPEEWFLMNEDDEVEVSNRVMGMQQAWFAGKYKLAMTTEGNFLEGDYRLRKVEDRMNLSRKFEYAVLLDEDNEHALEIEKYEDGTLAVFATVYRPATDIGEVARTVVKAPKLSVVIPEEKKEEDEVEQPPVIHAKFGNIQIAKAESESYSSDFLLVCESKLASGILNEAERNKMQLSELVRKVIDLPAQINEKILIPFTLNDNEYAELARRYELPVSDREAVRNRIVEELGHFIGYKK